MSTTLLQQTLKNAELDQYYDNLMSFGINSVELLTQLTMQDYSTLGIVGMEDRKSDFPGLSGDGMLHGSRDNRMAANPMSFLPKPTSQPTTVPYGYPLHQNQIPAQQLFQPPPTHLQMHMPPVQTQYAPPHLQPHLQPPPPMQPHMTAAIQSQVNMPDSLRVDAAPIVRPVSMDATNNMLRVPSYEGSAVPRPISMDASMKRADINNGMMRPVSMDASNMSNTRPPLDPNALRGPMMDMSLRSGPLDMSLRQSGSDTNIRSSSIDPPFRGQHRLSITQESVSRLPMTDEPQSEQQQESLHNRTRSRRSNTIGGSNGRLSPTGSAELNVYTADGYQSGGLAGPRSPPTPKSQAARRGHMKNLSMSAGGGIGGLPYPSDQSFSLQDQQQPPLTSQPSVINSNILNNNPQASPGKRPLLNAYGIPTTKSESSSKTLERRTPADINDRIRVCVRKRPLNKKELKRNEADIAVVNARRCISIHEPKVKVDLTKFVEEHSFVFDEVFDENASNEDVYKRTAWPLVEYIFSGGKATCFAYGQTGSGKTYTMLDESNGLYVMAGRDIFALLKHSQYSHLSAWVSFFEIYQGHLYDLLNNRKRLFAREDGKQQVCIAGLQEHEVDNVQHLMQIFEHGNATRSTGATGANADSSRSHAILQIVLKHKTGKQKMQGKFCFIDLAGSERGADRGDADKQTRQSKLTQVLKDSFIGNSRTCMIATISPNISNSEHTLNTLRYADRVKELKGDSNIATDRPDTPQYNHDSMQYLYQEQPQSDEDDPGLLIDEEFPPESLLLADEHDDHYIEDHNDDDDDDGNDLNGSFASLEADHQSSRLRSSNPPGYMPQMSSSSSSTNRGSNQRQRSPPPQPRPNVNGIKTDDNNFDSGDAQSAGNTNADSQGNGGLLGNTGGAISASNGFSITSDPDVVDELVRAHRQHIREMTELGKTESKLLVNFTMKGGGGGNAKSDRSVSFETYVKELDMLMERKLRALLAVRSQIKDILATSGNNENGDDARPNAR
ncbi:Kinesin-like protein kif24 [Quaeritorhiza haematococci]|nr:Kinesin-like protein kif24 [Quaeritorhiza haematococci]